MSVLDEQESCMLALDDNNIKSDCWMITSPESDHWMIETPTNNQWMIKTFCHNYWMIMIPELDDNNYL